MEREAVGEGVGGRKWGASRVPYGIQDGRCANLVPKFTLAEKNKIKVVESSSSKSSEDPPVFSGKTTSGKGRKRKKGEKKRV